MKEMNNHSLDFKKIKFDENRRVYDEKIDTDGLRLLIETADMAVEEGADSGNGLIKEMKFTLNQFFSTLPKNRVNKLMKECVKELLDRYENDFRFILFMHITNRGNNNERTIH